MSRKVLFLAEYNSQFTRNLLDKLTNASQEYEYAVLSGRNYYKDGNLIYQENNKSNKPAKLIEAWRLLNKVNVQTFDVVHIHFLSPIYLFYRKIFKARKVVVTFWGSDLYRIPKESKLRKFMQRDVLKHADAITVVNKKMIRDFQETFGFKDKPIFVTKLPVLVDLQTIDTLDQQTIELFRERYQIQKDDIILTLGYSADPRKNHEYMINEVLELNKNIKNIFVFLPMTYGNKEYREKIKKYCEETFQKHGVKYAVLENFMSDQEVAILRKITDVMVNVQDTDALSASMEESLYAGSIVINGAWLNYDELLEDGAYYETIPELKPGILASKLEYVIRNLPDLKSKARINREIIAKRNDWNEATQNFITLYNKLLEDKI
ncbi:MAG TPA: glycosyltransferase family 4 protein [Fervidobacterium sp.]|nr:glycosyltransferase family 4 protein [Fervidobacterium sp.]